MAVLEHEVHEKVKSKLGTQYGCKDRVHAAGYWVPNRQYYPDGRFEMIHSWIPQIMSAECRYDLSLSDPKCSECGHRGSGEAYNQMVREKGLA